MGGRYPSDLITKFFKALTDVEKIKSYPTF
jgi:hypothetical protein